MLVVFDWHSYLNTGWFDLPFFSVIIRLFWWSIPAIWQFCWVIGFVVRRKQFFRHRLNLLTLIEGFWGSFFTIWFIGTWFRTFLSFTWRFFIFLRVQWCRLWVMSFIYFWIRWFFIVFFIFFSIKFLFYLSFITIYQGISVSRFCATTALVEAVRWLASGAALILLTFAILGGRAMTQGCRFWGWGKSGLIASIVRLFIVGIRITLFKPAAYFYRIRVGCWGFLRWSANLIFFTIMLLFCCFIICRCCTIARCAKFWLWVRRFVFRIVYFFIVANYFVI
jgi:hypothetical protein